MRISLNSWSISIGLLFLSICISCVNNTSDTSEATADSVNHTILTEETLSSSLWEYDALKDTMVAPQLQDVPPTKEAIVEALNQRYADNIYLNLIRSSVDTVFVRIEDPTYLTQQIGSTGAFGYMAEVTYSLTEVPGIECVYFDFQEGDHVTPGLYKRKDFLNKL